jgi:ssDNA-binding Zn-finger/Zn-ribbon topoisomerase 1
MDATLQTVFKLGYERYKEHHGVSRDQHQAANAIMTCRCPELGYEEWVCQHDGHLEQQAHSCRHRSCPRCQSSYTQTWLDKTQARLLPCDHYHVVFTLPHELNEIWQYNREWSADHLFKASAETLRQLLKDERHLGADVGLLASLHTWGRTGSFHPHVHMLVTGGGLHAGQWRPLSRDFLLPVGVLKAKFRGKWLSWLNTAYAQGELKLPSHWSDSDWRRALRRIARKQWNVRIQGPYRHGSGVVNYLSRYLHGGPIKDHGLIEADASRVSFRYRDHHDAKEKTMTLKTEEFIHRVLWHVPVKGQHNVRYYGLYAPGASAKRDLIREQLDETPGETVKPSEKRERICPACGAVLFHYRSTRREISYIRSTRPLEGSGDIVQQPVRADRIGLGWLPPKGQAGIFWSGERRLN